MEASLRLARLCRLQAAQRLTAWLKRRAKTGGLRPQPPNTKKRRNGAWSASQQLQATGVAGCVRSGLLGPILARGRWSQCIGGWGRAPSEPAGRCSSLQHPAPAAQRRSRHSRARRCAASIKTIKTEFPPGWPPEAGAERGLAGIPSILWSFCGPLVVLLWLFCGLVRSFCSLFVVSCGLSVVLLWSSCGPLVVLFVVFASGFKFL